MRTLLLIFACKKAKYADTGEGERVVKKVKFCGCPLWMTSYVFRLFTGFLNIFCSLIQYNDIRAKGICLQLPAFSLGGVSYTQFLSYDISPLKTKVWDKKSWDEMSGYPRIIVWDNNVYTTLPLAGSTPGLAGTRVSPSVICCQLYAVW